MWSQPTKLSPCYVRPIVLRGYGQVGVNPFNSPTEVYIANYEWGKYLGAADCEDGVDVCVFLLDAPGAQHDAYHGQGWRKLHELATHQDGSHRKRL